MNELFKEKFKTLAEKSGWSLDHAKGFVDGEASRTRGKTPSKLALIGIDEYCRGFRAGYFEREKPGPMTSASPEKHGRVIGL